MLEVTSMIIVNMLIASLIGGVIGFLIGKNINKIKYIDNKNSKKVSHKKNKSNNTINPIFKKDSKLDNKPMILSSPKSSGKDNLKKIKGIDTQIEMELNSLGIYHFEQIANWSNKNCDWIEAYLLQPGCSKKDHWVEQAKILKSGKNTIFSLKVENGEIEVG